MTAQTMMPATIFLVILLLLSCSCDKSDYTPENTSLNIYQEDFLELASYIRRNHAGFNGKVLPVMADEEYTALVNSMTGILGETENIDDFLINLSWFLEKLHDGHTKIYFPFEEFAPITVSWFGDKLYIIAVDDSRWDSLLYGEVISLGNLSVKEYERRLYSYIPADKSHLLSKRNSAQEIMFSRPFLEYFGLLSEGGLLSINVLTDKGPIEETFPCRYERQSPRSVLNAKGRSAVTAGTMGNTWSLLPREDALYLQLNHLSGNVDKQLYENIFSLLQKNNLSFLIVDLRNNGGGNSLWCNKFLSYLVNEERDIYLYRSWASHYPGKDVARGKGITRIKPQRKDLIFDGEVIFLTSSYTFSSATFFVVAALDNGLGTVIGEPVGNTSLRYGYRAKPIELSHTGLTIYTTHHIWGRARPEMMNEREYIMPHILYTPTLEDLKSGRDGVFEAALSYINEKKRK